MLVCEMAAYYKNKGMTLYDGLMELYNKYGFYKEGVKSVTLKGVDGAEQIQKIMEYLRNNVPSDFAGNKVIWAKDYKTGVFKNLLTGENEASTLPKSNVLYYNLDDRAWLCVRPSGTEPKIKIYYTTLGNDLAEAQAEKDKLAEAVKPIMA